MQLPFQSSRQSSPLSSNSIVPDAHPRIAGFRIGDPMGVGPLGTIYRAQNEASGAVVVFRGFSKPQGADDANWREAERQFSDLLTAHQNIPDHPNVQKILGFGVEDELFWIAAERIEGVNLHHVLENYGAQSELWSRAVLAQIAAAVDWAGERGVCHTDLTPFNVLIATDDIELVQGVPLADVVKIKVINFGMAHARPKYGSPYAAPEQMDGFEGGRQSDVYSAGALLYAMLSGHAPFSGPTPDDIARRVRAEAPTPLANRQPHINQILATMIDKDARRRYGSVTEAVNDLQNGRAPSAATLPLVSQVVPIVPGFGAPFPTSPTLLSGASSSSNAGETTADRFNRLELDTPPVARPAAQAAGAQAAGGAMVFASAEEAYLATKASHIALQRYRLGDQNLLEIRARLEQVREKRARTTRTSQRLLVRNGIAATAVIVVLIAFAQAAHVPERYQSATVLGKTGDASVRRDGQKTFLNVGDSIPLLGHDAADNSIFVTGSGGRLLLNLAGSRLHLRENSAVQVKQAAYNGGPIRRFELVRGGVVAKVDPAHRDGAVFEIDSSGVRAVAKGTLYGVTRQQNQIVVASEDGAVRVVYGDGRATVGKGDQVAVKLSGGGSGRSVPEPSSISDSVKSGIDHSRDAIESVPGGSGVGSALAHAEEGTLLPIVEALGTVAHLPSYLSDRAAQLQAVGSMQAICVLMQTEAAIPGVGVPSSINLKSLKEIGLKDDATDRVLGSFMDKTLLSYHRLPGEGYEFLARANDSQHTLVRGRNGSATLVGNDDTDIPDTATPSRAQKASP